MIDHTQHEEDALVGRVFRRSLVLVLVIAAAVAAVLLLRRGGEPEPVMADAPAPVPAQRPLTQAAAPPHVRFTDITEAAGIGFVHVTGARGDKLMPETLGGGVAFLDYDGDGDQDLLFVNSTYWPDDPRAADQPTMALYRNDGSGRFEDVTAEAGLDVSFYGMGVAVGDYDGDGDPDLFFTAVGPNHLFRNDGGRFTEVTETAGVGGRSGDWSTGAAFLDIDNDGDLDLFVGNYIRWSPEIDFEIDFQLTGIGRAYGSPRDFEGSHSYLYRNDGGGQFTDVSRKAGIQVDNPATGRPLGKVLGLAPADYDNDGYIDIFVANDTVRNFLFHNRGDGSFEESAIPLGVAFDRNGGATGAMGTDAAFYRNNGDLGIGVGNFANEMSSLYVATAGTPLFSDDAILDGLGPPTRLALTFGLFFFDYDLDGRLDLFQANGHLEEEINKVQVSQHYAQPPQLFWNCGGECLATFVEAPGEQSGDLYRPLVGRGAAYADIDGDGDLDLVITQVGRRAVLLRNDQNLGHHWLRVKLVGDGNNREAIGARLWLTAGGITQQRRVMPTRSYLSQVELPVTFGLGDIDKVDSLRIRWPDGSEQTVKVPYVDTMIVIQKAADGLASSNQIPGPRPHDAVPETT